jgi:hypothetical protein
MFTNYGYTISQSLDYRSDKFITSEQNSIDMMTYHGTKKICNLDNNKSSNLGLSLKQSSAPSIEFLGQPILTIAHIVVNMNSIRDQ